MSTASATPTPPGRLVRAATIRLFSQQLGIPLLCLALGLIALTASAGGRAGPTHLSVVVLGSFLLWPAAAAFLLDQRPGDPVGLLLSCLGLVPVLAIVSATPVDGAGVDPDRLLSEGMAFWSLPAAAVLVGLPLLFPCGLPEGRAPRWVAGVTAGGTGIGVLSATARGHSETWLTVTLHNLALVSVAVLIGGAAAAAGVHVRQFRRAIGPQRSLRGWFLIGYGLVLLACAAVALLAKSDPVTAAYLAAALIAIVPIGLVMLQLAPPALDRAVARATVGVLSTAALGGVYLLVLVVISRTDLPQQETAAGVATGLAALALLPLLSRTREAVTVRLFGTGRHAGRTLAGLHDGLSTAADPDGVLPAVTAWVAGALGSPGACLHLAGQPPCRGPGTSMPLVVGGRSVGTLVVERRTPAEAFGRRDLALLEQITPAVALVAQAVAEMRRAESAERQTLDARDNERRRVLEDLHDSVGPELTGLGMHLASAAGVEDLDELKQILGVAESAVASACRTVRSLTNDLMTVGARRDLWRDLEQLVAGWNEASAVQGLALALEMPDGLPALPTEQQHHIFLVVGEALTNVVRHARAHYCTVRVTFAGTSLAIDVADDGQGRASAWRSGTGLPSMAARAQALGGTLTVNHPSAAGTTLRMEVPVR